MLGRLVLRRSAVGWAKNVSNIASQRAGSFNAQPLRSLTFARPNVLLPRVAARAAPARRRLTTGGSASEAIAAAPPTDAGMSKWLLGMAGLVFGMIVVGGTTRLTKSGLSMVHWSPLGRLPPMNEAEWIAEFEEYKKYPEYQRVNIGMDLEEFKSIFFWEYLHRAYGRCLGIFYGLPLMYFVAKGRVAKSGMTGRLGGLLLLGGAQGLVGWWMVKSGLFEPKENHVGDVRVSPYRLTAHLSMAIGLFSGLLWTGWSLSPNTVARMRMSSHTVIRCVPPVVGLTMVTVLSGAFVAGNDAGRAFNDWPLYAGNYLPEGIWKEKLGWRNFTENTATVQFDHRSLAYLTLASTTALHVASVRAPREQVPKTIVRASALLAGAAWTQALLGVLTLVNIVPVWLGTLHQAGAMTVWTAALWMLRKGKGL